MDLANIKNRNGFVGELDLVRRMRRFRPPDGDHFRLRQIKNSSFSEVCVVAYGLVAMPLFRVCTVNKELYECVRGLFLSAASLLGWPAQADEWSERYDKD